MCRFNEIVTREVTRYLRATGISQTALGAACGIAQPVLSKKLLGASRWSLADLDRLASAGVPISITASTLETE
uniref:Regulatory protein n=1 Tax=Siphoviridae sp. ctHSY3 TaxID=2825421 RepID=A0A8S5TUY4_9CAUD|nr:MAG TPA: regulatory protein [Siphoviridae sp. ctHSY3]